MKRGKSQNGRDEVLVYYSGHADEKGLRLGNEVYGWKEFRKRIDALNADVKIAVIDACGSGAITRLKGGVAVPAFMVDQSSDMKGYAFITSSTQDESSQESDKLKGSFFTHSLVSGLRGAGDASGDGKVTLSEAYQFAFNETLQRTEKTLGGAQHPSRDMNLAGTGDVVMTDLRSTSAGLDLDEDVDGRLFIRDSRGELVAELFKKGGRAMSLGFPAGRYSIRLERPAEYSEAIVILQDNYRARLTHRQFAAVSAEKTTLRGEIGGTRNCESGDTIACSLDSLDHHGKYRVTFNAVDKDSEPRKGIQLGFFVAKASENMLGSGINYAKQADVQVGIVNVARETNVQASVMNIAKKVDGPQISVMNVAGEMNGPQISVMNIAKKVDGPQISVMNIAGKIEGPQMSVMNIAGKINGPQLSLMNIAGKSKGRQVGLLNICGYCEETPVGLISLVGNGVWSVTGSLNEMGALDLSFRFGTPYLFTAIEGTRRVEDPENRHIRLYVSSQKGFLKILAENTFCGTVSFEGGIPATSKTYEVGYHGYGVRSIRATAEKYGGNAMMKTVDGWFQVHVLIPQQET